jgi:DNA-binding winged helix-turn-helix (wHTH) protein/tetratricopeptide (TPR) repeat protein/TolB-like protein
MDSRRVCFGPFLIDLDSGTLRKEGRAVKLAPQPATLLSLLVRQAGEVVTRDAIQKTLWPAGTFVDFDQGISFCIKQIRVALGDDAATPRYIATVPRRGYRFVAEVKPLEAADKADTRPAVIVAAVVALGLGAIALTVTRHDVALDTTRPTVSVTPFENRTGDADLDWLRAGVSEMLITELAESREVEVSRGDSETVVRGSFLRVGDRVRIDAHLENGRTGMVVGSAKVEGTIDMELLPMMEELSKRVRLQLELTARGHDLDLPAMTTSSVEAYRYYIEGLDRMQRNAWNEAVPYFEEALRIDPEFATALVSLAMSHGFLGTEVEKGRWAGSPEWVNANWEKRRRLTERAFELSNRLPGRERFHIEGHYYRMNGDDARAIAAFEKTIDIYPDHLLARMALASRFSAHQELEKGIEQLEAIHERSGAFHVGGTQSEPLELFLAEMYDNLGKSDDASRVLEELRARFPDDSRAHEALGGHLVFLGRLDEAVAEFERAHRLRKDGSTPIGVATVQILRGDWDDAAAISEDNRFYRAIVGLYRGHSSASISLLQTMSDYERIYCGWPGVYLNETLLQLDRPEDALQLETEPVFQAMALARLGRIEDATSENRPFRGANTRLSRLLNRRLGAELAMARGDDAKAIEELEEAERLLPPRGGIADETPQHVPVWYSLARINLDVGHTAEASRWLGKIVGSTTERLPWPIPYVRSLYLLGAIHEAREEMDEAALFYGRFYTLWKDGDLDRDWIAHAERTLKHVNPTD